MKIPCVDIAEAIKSDLKKQTRQLKKQGVVPKLITILIGDAPEQLSFVSTKKKVAAEIGVIFEFVHFKKCPSFIDFASKLRALAHDPQTTGVIIQLPFPSHLQSDTIYNYIPPVKELEGHRIKSPHLPPLGSAVITLLKYVIKPQTKAPAVYPDPTSDKTLFKQFLKHKKIVLIGRGITGGHPIAKTLSEYKINFINVNSQTQDPNQYYKEADIIITAAGKKVIDPAMLKQGVILINVGLHKKGHKLRGDYYEEDIEKIAGWYSQTPKGTGPLDVLFLYKNLIEAANLQLK